MDFTEKQKNIMSCLIEMQRRLSTETVSNLRNISGNMPVSNKIDQAVKNLSIVLNGGDGYTWNPSIETITDELVLDVENNINDPHHEKSLQLFEQFQKTNEPYPIPFEHVWKILGYASKQMAKTALYQEFNENEDFINFNNDIEVSRENAGSRGPIEEMLRLSWECFVHFTHNAQTRTAKLVSKKIIKEYFSTIRKLDQANRIKDIHILRNSDDWDYILKIDEAQQVLSKLKKKVENHLSDRMKIKKVDPSLFDEELYDFSFIQETTMRHISQISELLLVDKFVSVNYKLLPHASKFQAITDARESHQ